MTYRIRAGAAVLVAAALLAGCGPASSADPTPTTPAATPSSATPTPSPTPSPTAAQAEKTYRDLTELQHQLLKQGGISPDDKAPASLRALTEGQALADYTSELVQAFNKGSKWISGWYTITGVTQIDDQSNPDAQIALVSCVDGRAIRTSWADGSTSNGNLVRVTSWYRITKDGTLKQIDFYSKKVSSCDVK